MLCSCLDGSGDIFFFTFCLSLITNCNLQEGCLNDIYILKYLGLGCDINIFFETGL